MNVARRALVVLVALAAGASALVMQAPSPASALSDRPHLVVIAVDDLSYWALRAAQHTEGFDRLARDGMVFNNAYANATVCNPSRASLTTGLLPKNTNVLANEHKGNGDGINDTLWQEWMNTHPPSGSGADPGYRIRTLWEHFADPAGDNPELDTGGIYNALVGQQFQGTDADRHYDTALVGKVNHNNAQQYAEPTPYRDWNAPLWRTNPFWGEVFGGPLQGPELPESPERSLHNVENLPVHGDAALAAAVEDVDWGVVQDEKDIDGNPIAPSYLLTDPTAPDDGINAVIEAAGDTGTGQPEPATESDLIDVRIARSTRRLVAEAATRPNRPFFLSVGFYAPHFPNYVPSRYLAPYYDAATDDWLVEDLDGYEGMPGLAGDLTDIGSGAALGGRDPQVVGFKDGDRTLLADSEAHQALVAHHLAAVDFVDDQIEEVIAELEARNMYENSTIVLWSDHGLQMGQKESVRKQYVWDESTHIPLTIKPPSMGDTSWDVGTTGPTGDIVSTNAFVSTVDLYPTLVEMAGYEMPADGFVRDGRSLVRLLQVRNALWPFLVTTQVENAFVASPTGFPQRYSVAIRGPDPEPASGQALIYVAHPSPTGRTIASRELYRRPLDPTAITHLDTSVETTNLINTSNLNGPLAAWLEKVAIEQERPNRPPVPATQRWSVEKIVPPASIPDTSTPDPGDTLTNIFRITIKASDPSWDPPIVQVTSQPATGLLRHSWLGSSVGAGVLTGQHLRDAPGPCVYAFYVPENPDFTGTRSIGFRSTDGKARPPGSSGADVVTIPFTSATGVQTSTPAPAQC